MALRNRHQYCRAHILTQYVNSPYKYTNYIDKSTPQTIGDDNYRLDYVTEYLDDSKQTNIFIGDKTECVVGTITDENPDIVVITSFKNFTIEDTDYESASNQNSIKFMNTVLHHFKTELKIKCVKIRDNAILYNQDERMPISIIYFLRYNETYYMKNLGFQLYNDMSLIEFNDTIQRVKAHYYNKIIVKQYYTPDDYPIEIVDKFLSGLYDTELVGDFVRRYKIAESELLIFFEFLRRCRYYDKLQDLWYYIEL